MYSLSGVSFSAGRTLRLGAALLGVAFFLATGFFSVTFFAVTFLAGAFLAGAFFLAVAFLMGFLSVLIGGTLAQGQPPVVDLHCWALSKASV